MICFTKPIGELLFPSGIRVLLPLAKARCNFPNQEGTAYLGVVHRRNSTGRGRGHSGLRWTLYPVAAQNCILQRPSGISRHDGIVGNVGNHAAGIDYCILSNVAPQRIVVLVPIEAPRITSVLTTRRSASDCGDPSWLVACGYLS